MIQLSDVENLKRKCRLRGDILLNMDFIGDVSLLAFLR
jgi:hypothetical protein